MLRTLLGCELSAGLGIACHLMSPCSHDIMHYFVSCHVMTCHVSSCHLVSCRHAVDDRTRLYLPSQMVQQGFDFVSYNIYDFAAIRDKAGQLGH